MSHMLSRNEVTEVTLSDLYWKAKDAYDDLWTMANERDRHVKLYLHWTAGRYHQFWDDYHVQIDNDGKIYMPDDTSLSDILSGTWRRNTAAISISILGCFDATTRNGLGSNPPTAAALESLYQVVCVLADALDLTIDINHVMTHGEAGDNEDGWEAHEEYGPKTTCERWDLEYLGTDESPEFNPWNEGCRGGDIIRGKANWYRSYYEQKVYEYFNNSQDQIKTK